MAFIVSTCHIITRQLIIIYQYFDFEATELILLNIVLMNDFIVRTVSTTIGIV